MLLSIVVPCYHPPEGWEDRVIASATAMAIEVENSLQLILVCDGKDAGVTETAMATITKVLPKVEYITYEQNKGKGFAIRKGVEAATGDIILYTDIDFPYTLVSMAELFRTLSNDICDVAIGVKDADYYRHVPALRRTISHSLRHLIRLFLSIPITDTQCGLKGFVASVKPIFLSTTIDRYLFDLEFVRACFRSPARPRVKAIPIHLRDGIIFRKMNMRILIPEMANFFRILTKRADRNEY